MIKNSANKIMVVEDEAVIALRLQQLLTEMGYNVIGISYSGEDALEKARSLRPDLLLMDIMIPGKLDGITVAEIVKSELDIPVIFLTAFSEDKIIERAIEAEPFGYILKPFQDREIKAGIEVALYKKEMEKKLRESEKKFKNFLENLADIAYETDSSGNVTYANKMAEIITSVPLKDIIGKPFLPLFTEESQAIAMDVYQRTLKGESPLFDLTFTNGRICRYKNEPLKDKEGQIIGVFGIARDITDLKRAEEALKASEDNFRALAENANDAILIAVGDGTHVFANKRAAEITGYRISELLKTTIKDLAHPDEFEEIKKRYRTIISGKSFNRQYETKMIRKNGKEMPIEVASARSQWQGKPADIVVIRDLTERVKAEEVLKKAHNELEHRVKERTFELNTAFKTIQRSEGELTQRKLALEKLNRELMETNLALSILARNIDKDKDLLEKKIYETISTNIIPIIIELQDDKSCLKRLAELELLKTYLNGLIPGPTDHHEIIVCLSNQEMRVAEMIKRGLTSPKIAEMLNVSLHTVKAHRKNIRKKLELQNTNVNLTSYLKSIFRE